MNIIDLSGKENILKFNFFVSYYQHLSTIQDDSEKWMAIDAVMKYAFYGIEPDLSMLPPQALGFFFAVKPTLDKGIADSVNGKNGGKKSRKSNSETPCEKKERGVTEKNNPPSDFSETEIEEGIGIGEGIGEEKEDIADSSYEESVSAEPTASNRVPYQEIIDLYNSVCVSFPQVTRLTEQRRKTIRSRYREYGMDGIRKVFESAEASDFLSGRNGKWMNCSYDWLMKQGNFLKVFEGNYPAEGSVRNGASNTSYSEAELEEIFADSIF